MDDLVAKFFTRRRALQSLFLAGAGASLGALPGAGQAGRSRPPKRGGYPYPDAEAAAPPLEVAGRFRGARVSDVYDVRAFGAKGDGNAVDTPAINAAIVAAARAGGGTVSFPAGTYRCYSIHLQSRVALYLGPGATIVAAACKALGGAGDYDEAEPNPAAGEYEDFGHRHWHNALLWGEGIENAAILGTGTIVSG